MASTQFPTLDVRIERFPIAGSFTISRGAKTEAVTVVAELRQGGLTGRGECVPYPRYGETPEETLKVLQAIREAVSDGFNRQALQAAMPAGAARNALDCAFIDLEAKSAGKRAWELLAAVRRAAPESELIVDANEAWTPSDLERNLAACAEAGVTLVEQPLPSGWDDMLGRIRRPVRVCADESVHDRKSLDSLRGRYDAVNIKLDKTGGLTEALAMA